MPTVSKKLTFWQFWQSRLVRQIVMFFELECAMESLAVIRTSYFGWLQLLTHKVDDTVVEIYCVIKNIRVCNLLFIHSIGWRTKAIVFGTDVSQYRHLTDCLQSYNDVAFRLGRGSHYCTLKNLEIRVWRFMRTSDYSDYWMSVDSQQLVTYFDDLRLQNMLSW